MKPGSLFWSWRKLNLFTDDWVCIKVLDSFNSLFRWGFLKGSFPSSHNKSLSVVSVVFTALAFSLITKYCCIFCIDISAISLDDMITYCVIAEVKND